MELYERFGFRCSFNVEVLQQLKHLEWSEGHPELRDIAREWEELVREMWQRGHDVELHVHIQWVDARYDTTDGWELGSDWNLSSYEPEVARDVLTRCRDYLVSVLRPIDPDYAPVAYRGGAWALTPSPYALQLLSDLGIVFDMTVVRGVYYDTPGIRLDYRGAEEGLFPFYPEMGNANLVSKQVEPIVCVPTFTGFVEQAIYEDRERLSANDPGRYRREFLSPSATPLAGARTRSKGSAFALATPAGPTVVSPAQKQFFHGTHPDLRIFDLSTLCFRESQCLVTGLKRRAARVRSPQPVILENHSKDLGDLAPIELFCQMISDDADIEVITSRDCAQRLQTGYYPIRTSQSLGLPADALTSRVQERKARVSERLRTLADVDPARISPRPADSEEALRILMVKYWPRGEGTRALSCLATIEPLSPALWRFWDAWNNVFESLDMLQLPDAERKWFLSRYLRVLDNMPAIGSPSSSEAATRVAVDEARP